MLKHAITITIISSATLFSLPIISHARLNTLTGGITMGYDYDETQYDTDTNTTPQNRYFKQMSIAPLLILESSSTIDNLTLRINPALVYNLDDYETNVNNNFLLTASRDFTRRLNIELSEGFVYSDDPELIQPANNFDYNEGRRRYWTNDFDIRSTYQYNTDSTFQAGYTYRVLRNDDTGIGGYEDYDRHIGDLALQHHINASWNFGINASYTKGLFDPPQLAIDAISSDSNDLSEYRGGASVNWIATPRVTAFTRYDYIGSNYDAPLRHDSNIHNLTLGATFQYSPRLTLEAGGGPSYEKTDTFDSNTDYNAHASLNYDVAEHTTFGLTGAKGYDQQNFSASNNALGSNQGLTEFDDWQMNISHALTNELNLNAFASYRNEKQRSIVHLLAVNDATGGALADADRETLRQESVFSRDVYSLGGSLNYTFLHWYTAAVNYTFRTQDSELLNDSYDEHRIYLTLSFQKELLRW